MENVTNTRRAYRSRSGEQRQRHTRRLQRKYNYRRFFVAIALVVLLVVIGYVISLGVMFAADMFGHLIVFR